MENERFLTALSAVTLRGLIKEANVKGIRREDIVTIMKENEAFFLLYYKQENK